MDPLENQISTLTSILTTFITEQKQFNTEQRAFNAHVETRFTGIETRFDTVETRLDTIETRFDTVDKKIDKIQYFLEETIAENTKMFFEEQIEIKTNMRELESEVSKLRESVTLLTSELNILKLRFAS